MDQTQNDEYSENLITKKKDFGHLDQVLEYVGNQGIFQKVVMFQFFCQWAFLGYAFYTASYICTPPTFTDKNQKESDDQCSSYQLASDYKMNITREFGLYCDKEFYRSLFESSPFVGAIFGMLIFAYTSDNYGRKITILLSWFLASIGYFLLYFATSTWQLIIFNALVGAGIWPALIYNFVYVSEIFSLTYRKLSTGFLFLGSSMFGVVLAALAYYFDNWRYLVLTGAVPMLLLNFLSFYLVETPNFYSSRNLEKTVQSYNQIKNKNMLKDKEDVHVKDIKDLIIIKANIQTYTYIDIFRYKSVMIPVIGCSLYYFGIEMLGFGSSFAIAEIGINMYLNGIIFAICDSIGCLIGIYCSFKWKRKWGLFFGGIFASILLLPTIFIKIPDECDNDDTLCTQKWVHSALASIAKLISSCLFSLIWTYYIELFPSTIKSTATGFIKILGLFSVIAAPFLISFCTDHNIPAAFMLGCVYFVMTFGILMCKETLGAELITEIPEVANRHKSSDQFQPIQDDIKEIDSQNTYI